MPRSPDGTQYEVMCAAVQKLVPELFPRAGTSESETNRLLNTMLIWVECVSPRAGTLHTQIRAVAVSPFLPLALNGFILQLRKHPAEPAGVTAARD